MKIKFTQNNAKFLNRNLVATVIFSSWFSLVKSIYQEDYLSIYQRLVYFENSGFGGSQLGLDVTCTAVLEYVVINAATPQYVTHLFFT